MIEIFTGLFDPSGFPRRWDCGDWSDELGWLHILSDLGVWSAYVAIPCVLGYFVLRKKDVPFRMVFCLFGAFILACGSTHLMEAIIFWWPGYRLAGVLKLMTALVSWGTVIALVPITPRALAMRSPEELEREIVDRRRAEEELGRYAERLEATNRRLVEAERIKGDLLANVSHELRTPLTLILAPLETLLSGDNGPITPDQRAGLQTVHNNAVRLLQMVTGLLDLSKRDADKVVVNREPMEVVSATRAILEDFRPTLERAGLAFGLESRVPEAWLRIDRYLFERILFNLLSNAIKFTPSGGRIGVALEVADDRLSVMVTDTGIGIAVADQSSLFQKFRQIEASSTRRFEGTGLGLALVKEFAGLMGGTASVQSEPGRGSTFRVDILAPRCEPGDDAHRGAALVSDADMPADPGTGYPGHVAGLLQRYEPAAAMSQDANGTAGDDERPRVLIAEDNPEMAAYLASLLRGQYRVRVGSDGDAALLLAREWAPDLVLADVMMPGRDGFEICRTLKSDPRLGLVPVVLLTALTNRDALMRGWEAGADEYLYKPFHPIELRTRIRTILDAATQRRAAAERERHRLREEGEEQFHTLADSIPQLAWMARSDGWIFWYNRRWYEFTGRTPEEMLGWGWQSVHSPTELPRVLERYRAAIEAGRPWEDTFPLRRHDGVMRWHLSRALPIHDEAGRIVRWFGTNTDITDRLEMEEALKESNRQKDEFLAMLAHELRNPLAPIRNSLEVLKLAQSSSEAFGLAVEMSERQVRHMARLLDDLLDVSRISRGRIELRIERVELDSLLRRARGAVDGLIRERGHQVSLVLPAEPITVMGDATRIEQVVVNLLNNAAKYTEPGGRIVVELGREGSEVVLRIRDNGIGIAPEMLTRIFDLFVQVERRVERSQGGVGIGLTLVRKLVELHGGTVEAHSDGLGHGSEFVVRLPEPANRNGEPGPSIQELDRLNYATSRHRVLVVDDNVDAAVSLGMLLKLAGQEVRVAYDGPAALRQAMDFRPQLVLLDIGMPGMDGYEVCRRIRSESALVRTTVVALTGWGQEDDRRRSHEAGFDHHIVKPVEPSALQRLLDELPADPPAAGSVPGGDAQAATDNHE